MKEWVIGIDSYAAIDSRMRWERTEQLLAQNESLTVIHANVCKNASLLQDLVERYEVQRIVAMESGWECLYNISLELNQTEFRPIPLYLPHTQTVNASYDNAPNVHVLNFPVAYGPWIWPYSGDFTNFGQSVVFQSLSNRSIFVDDITCGTMKFMQSTAKVLNFLSPPYKSKLTTNGSEAACVVEKHGVSLIVRPSMSFHDGLNKSLDWFTKYESSRIPCETVCKSKWSTCSETPWKLVAKVSTLFTSGCDIVLYTVLIGKVNAIHPVTEHWSTNSSCNIAFISADSKLWKNEKLREHSRWTFVAVPSLSSFYSDTRKASRLPKLSPDLFFADSVRHAVYIDGKLEINITPECLMELYTRGDSDNSSTVMMLVSHWITRDLAHDAGLVLANDRSNITHYPQLLVKQVLSYESYRANSDNSSSRLCYANTFDGAFIVHDLKSPTARQIRCAWLREFSLWSDRDQVSGAF
eukprot:scaffold15906_cov348-Ochromonas_danica.AAC.1